jgi:hypothetical protein
MSSSWPEHISTWRIVLCDSCCIKGIQIKKKRTRMPVRQTPKPSQPAARLEWNVKTEWCAASIAVHRVAEFVRHGGDVAGIARIVQQDVRRKARHDAVAKSAAKFAWSGRGIDVEIAEHLLGKIGQPGRKASIGFQHHAHGVRVLVFFHVGAVGA